jgi:hypothetical protein
MKLAVIEGKWFKRHNTSVRGMFDLLSDICCESPHHYHYEMFNDGRAFREILLRLSASDGIHNIYVAGHGDKSSIAGSNSEPISKTIIKNAIAEAAENHGRLDSIYFGSCLFGSINVLQELITAGTRIRWVAGYENEIDFIDSSSFDWLFWNFYVRTEGTALERIAETVNQLQKDASGLINRLGFRVCAWDGNFKVLI